MREGIRFQRCTGPHLGFGGKGGRPADVVERNPKIGPIGNSFPAATSASKTLLHERIRFPREGRAVGRSGSA